MATASNGVKHLQWEFDGVRGQGRGVCVCEVANRWKFGKWEKLKEILKFNIHD